MQTTVERGHKKRKEKQFLMYKWTTKRLGLVQKLPLISECVRGIYEWDASKLWASLGDLKDILSNKSKSGYYKAKRNKLTDGHMPQRTK